MKLVRYGRAGAEKPGLIDPDGKLRDLSRIVKDITPDALSPAALNKLRAVNAAKLPLVGGKPRLGPPLAGIGKMVCIGLNYADHAREVGRPAPARAVALHQGEQLDQRAPTIRSCARATPPSSTTRWSSRRCSAATRATSARPTP